MRVAEMIDPRPFVKTGGLNDKRVAFPPADGITNSEVNTTTELVIRFGIWKLLDICNLGSAVCKDLQEGTARTLKAQECLCFLCFLWFRFLPSHRSDAPVLARRLGFV